MRLASLLTKPFRVGKDRHAAYHGPNLKYSEIALQTLTARSPEVGGPYDLDFARLVTSLVHRLPAHVDT